jgi:hypothetical protein
MALPTQGAVLDHQTSGVYHLHQDNAMVELVDLVWSLSVIQHPHKGKKWHITH